MANGDGIKISTPGGWGLAASGRDVILLIAIICGFVSVCWIMANGFRDINQAFRETRSDHVAIQRANQDLVCVLALDQGYRLDAVRSGNVCQYAMALSTVERRPK